MNYTQKDYYIIITHSEWIKFIIDKFINFNVRYINRLLQISDKFKIVKDIDKIYIRFNNRLRIDEWFLIANMGNYYKCDQYDGLIYCLKDIHIL